MEAISAVIIVKNESNNLKKLLPTLAWCHEIIVVDDFSTDNTVDICTKHNCKIFQRQLEGFGEQKQFAVSKASNKWIFSIDADELLSGNLLNEIRDKFNKSDNLPAAFSIRRRHEFMGHEFKYSSESHSTYLRLFDKSKANFNSAKVHEIVETSNPIQEFKDGYLIHHSFMDLAHYFEKSNKYSTLAAQMAFAKGKRKNMFGVLMLSPFLFMKAYLVDLNFMEGLPGLLWALFQNWYRIVKYAKLNEMYRQTK